MQKYLWAAIAILTTLVLGLAGYIYEQGYDAKGTAPRPGLNRNAGTGKAPDAQWEELEKWRENAHKQIASGAPMQDPDFDSFFDDRFFGRKYDPFAEMTLIYRQMMAEFGEPERTLFNDSWGRWYGRRMLMGQFKTDVTRTDKEVMLTLQLPGLTAKTANIDITDDRIKISFSARTVSENKSAGTESKRESSESYVKILSVPEDAVAGTGKVEIDGERVKIIFARKKYPK